MKKINDFFINKKSKFLIVCLFFLCLQTSCKKEPPPHITHKASEKNIATAKDIDDITYQQSVYAPVYSEIHNYNEHHTIALSANLSVRNIDKKEKIFIYKIDYYDTEGKLIREYLKKPIFLNPLQTDSYVVEFVESKGGTGANFIVEWGSQKKVASPIIETVMISTQNNMGISFVSNSKVIEEKIKTKK